MDQFTEDYFEYPGYQKTTPRQRQLDQLSYNLEQSKESLSSALAVLTKMPPTDTAKNSSGKNKAGKNRSVDSVAPPAGLVREFPIEIRLKQLDGKIKTPMRRTGRAVSAIPQEVQAQLDRDDANVPQLIQAHAVKMIRCGEVDVWWSRSAVLVMREKGLMEEIFVDRGAKFSDVVWDGENVWIASQRDGVGVLDMETLNYSCLFGRDDGLPLANAGLQIIDVAPGRLLAVGSFGKSLRAWCATIEFGGSAPDQELIANVFHEAINPAVDEAGNPDWSNPAITFVPGWIIKFEPLDGSPIKILVGRSGRRSSKGPTLGDRSRIVGRFG